MSKLIYAALVLPSILCCSNAFVSHESFTSTLPMVANSMLEWQKSLEFLDLIKVIESLYLVSIFMAVTYIIFASVGYLLSKHLYRSASVYRKIIVILLKKLPEYFMILAPLWIGKLLPVLIIDTLEIKLLQSCFSFISEIIVITSLSDIVVKILTLAVNKHIRLLYTYILLISSVRIIRIFFRFALIVTHYKVTLDYELSQIEATALFIIILSLILQIRKITHILSHFTKILPYATVIGIALAILAYVTNNQGIRFVYKLIMAILTWPLILQLVHIIKDFTKQYIIRLPRTSNEGLRKPIQIWLLLIQVAKILTLPLSVLIIMYIFDLNIIREIYSVLSYHVSIKIYILLAIYVVIRILFLLNNYFTDLYTDSCAISRPFDMQRIKTFAKIIRYTVGILISIVIALVLFSLFGYNTGPFFQTLGLFSAALTFSLQSLIRDIINGIVILYENSMKVGDWIDYEGKTAVIEDMSLRYIRARFDDGTLVTIPFHKLDIIKNKSRYHSYIVYNVSVARSVPIDNFEQVTIQAFSKILERPEFKYKIIGRDLELRDVAEVTGYCYVYQFRVSVQPQSQFKVKRALNRQLLLAYEENDIKIALPMVANTLIVPGLSTGEIYPDFV